MLFAPPRSQTPLWRRLRFWRGAAPLPFRVPEGERIYAIGDIHGRCDLFEALLDQIMRDNDMRGPAYSRLILLGDLIDRGDTSRDVIDLAMHAAGQFDSFAWLTGNHEELFMGALDGDVDILRVFLRNGGRETILSYGIDADFLARLSFEELSAALPALVPPAHRDFLRTGQDTAVHGDYLFVHAGVRPGVTLENQSRRDLRWIRHEFVNDMSFHGHVVVHGHTISDEPVNLPYRIGIDTGAFRSNRLTAVGLEANQRWFLSTL